MEYISLYYFTSIINIVKIILILFFLFLLYKCIEIEKEEFGGYKIVKIHKKEFVLTIITMFFVFSLINMIKVNFAKEDKMVTKQHNYQNLGMKERYEVKKEEVGEFNFTNALNNFDKDLKKESSNEKFK